MKKFFFAACAALALTACSDVTDEVAVVSRVPISVEVYTQGNVRAAYTPTTTATLTSFNLKISSGTGANDINEEVTVTKDNNGSWTMSENIYWPLEASKVVSFIAYTGTATGNILNTFTSDIVVATASQASSAGTTVALNFGHILSDVAITTKCGTSGYSINLTAFSIKPSVETFVDQYNLSTSTWTSSNGTPTSLYTLANPLTVTDDGVSIIDKSILAVPQSYDISATFTVTDSNGNTDSAPRTRTGSFSLVAGTQNIIEITLPTDLATMSVSATVTAWDAPETNQVPLN